MSLFTLVPQPRVDADPLLGFTAEGAERQLALEADMDRRIEAVDLAAWLKRLAAAPNHVGAPHTKENAEWMASQFRSWGYAVRIETYHVLFPTPTVRVLEMVAPTRFSPSLDEPALEEDATSSGRSIMPTRYVKRPWRPQDDWEAHCQCSDDSSQSHIRDKPTLEASADSMAASIVTRTAQSLHVSCERSVCGRGLSALLG